jgi:repressor of nif and glnA expression
MLFFGFTWRLKRLRNRWNKLRKKALGQEKNKKGKLLNMLDDVENDLRVLEEQELTRKDRNKIIKKVEDGLKEVEIVLKSKEIEESNKELEEYE